MPLFICREMLKIQHYRKPEKGKPLNLFVHPSKTYDERTLAFEGTLRTMVMQPYKFNILEIVDQTDDIHFSYTGMHMANMVKAGNSGFIFDKDVISRIPYFKTLFETNEFIINGGAAMRCHNWAFLSLLAIKTMSRGEKLAELFKGDKDHYEWAKAMLKNGSMLSLNIQNGKVVNFHFNAEAIYADVKDLAIFDGKNLEIAKYNECHDPKEVKRYPDWLTLCLESPHFEDYMPTAIAKGLPDFYRAKLKNCGLNINEYLDGEKIDMPVSEDPSTDITVNLYYWSTTTGMAEHFSKTLG